MTKEEASRIKGKMFKGGYYAQEKARQSKNIRDKRYWEGRAYAYSDCIEAIEQEVQDEKVDLNQLALLDSY